MLCPYVYQKAKCTFCFVNPSSMIGIRLLNMFKKIFTELTSSSSHIMEKHQQSMAYLV